jgi:quinol-cytochrome oxidoreductase complex cytochrome b subunit
MKFIDLYIELRDFCYVRSHKRYGDKYAKSEHKFDLKVLFSPYYMAILIIISGLINKSGGNLNFVENNFINTIIVMSPVVIVYNWLFNFIYSKAVEISIDKEMDDRKYQTLARKSTVIFIIGLLLFFLTPFFIFESE